MTDSGACTWRWRFSAKFLLRNYIFFSSKSAETERTISQGAKHPVSNFRDMFFLQSEYFNIKIIILIKLNLSTNIMLRISQDIMIHTDKMI
jgi:hypothetical protein